MKRVFLYSTLLFLLITILSISNKIDYISNHEFIFREFHGALFSMPASCVLLIVIISLRVNNFKKGLFLVIGFSIIFLIELSLKLIFPETSSGFPPLIILGEEFGFYPSGHAARGTFLLILLLVSFDLQRNYLAILGTSLLVLFGGFILVFTGVHWTLDAIGGMLLGISCLSGAFFFFSRGSEPGSERGSFS